MTFFARNWLDRVLGRGSKSGDPVDERAQARSADPSREPEAGTDELEEGATAARDEAIPGRADMPPPGTS